MKYYLSPWKIAFKYQIIATQSTFQIFKTLHCNCPKKKSFHKLLTSPSLSFPKRLLCFVSCTFAKKKTKKKQPTDNRKVPVLIHWVAAVKISEQKHFFNTINSTLKGTTGSCGIEEQLWVCRNIPEKNISAQQSGAETSKGEENHIELVNYWDSLHF